jgi:hypothetical protein
MLPAASEITFESRGRSLLSGDALIGADVRLWHLADVQTKLMNVRFERNNGHEADVTRCLLMTQSGLSGSAQAREALATLARDGAV